MALTPQRGSGAQAQGMCMGVCKAWQHRPGSSPDKPHQGPKVALAHDQPAPAAMKNEAFWPMTAWCCPTALRLCCPACRPLHLPLAVMDLAAPSGPAAYGQRALHLGPCAPVAVGVARAAVAAVGHAVAVPVPATAVQPPLAIAFCPCRLAVALSGACLNPVARCPHRAFAAPLPVAFHPDLAPARAWVRLAARGRGGAGR